MYSIRASLLRLHHRSCQARLQSLLHHRSISLGFLNPCLVSRNVRKVRETNILKFYLFCFIFFSWILILIHSENFALLLHLLRKQSIVCARAFCCCCSMFLIFRFLFYFYFYEFRFRRWGAGRANRCSCKGWRSERGAPWLHKLGESFCNILFSGNRFVLCLVAVKMREKKPIRVFYSTLTNTALGSSFPQKATM